MRNDVGFEPLSSYLISRNDGFDSNETNHVTGENLEVHSFSCLVENQLLNSQIETHADRRTIVPRNNRVLPRCAVGIQFD